MSCRLNLIRTLAIVLVMLGHSIIIYEPSWTIINTDIEAPYFVLLKQVINLVQMPLFFALSGYLFFYTLQKKGSLMELMRNKTSRLLLPFIMVGVFFMIPIKTLLAVPGYILPIGGVSKAACLITSKGIMWDIYGFCQLCFLSWYFVL